MGKAYYVGIGADEMMKDHEQIVEGLKRAFVRHFGKFYEGQIDSILDYAQFVYFDPSAFHQQNEIVDELIAKLSAQFGVTADRYFYAELVNLCFANLSKFAVDKMNREKGEAAIDLCTHINRGLFPGMNLRERKADAAANLDERLAFVTKNRENLLVMSVLVEVFNREANVFGMELDELMDNIFGDIFLFETGGMWDYDQLPEKLKDKLKEAVYDFVDEDGVDPSLMEEVEKTLGVEDPKIRDALPNLIEEAYSCYRVLDDAQNVVRSRLLESVESTDFGREISSYRKNSSVRIGTPGEAIDDLADLLFNPDAAVTATCYTIGNLRKRTWYDVCMLPYDVDNTVVVHEALHLISGRYSYEPYGHNGRPCEKSGLQFKHKGWVLNELFTEWQALKIDQEMKEAGDTVGCENAFPDCIYDDVLPLVDDLFAKYEDPFLRGYLGSDLEECMQLFSKRGFERLVTCFDDLLEACEEFGGDIRGIVDAYMIESEPKRLAMLEIVKADELRCGGTEEEFNTILALVKAARDAVEVVGARAEQASGKEREDG